MWGRLRERLLERLFVTAPSAALRRGNPSTWLLLRLLALPSRFETFARVYAYFRWADDIIDAPARDAGAVRSFAASQAAFLAGNRGPETPEERLLAPTLSLVAIRPAIDGMWAALAFDAARGPEPLAAELLDTQVARVGDAWARAAAWCAGEDTALDERVLELSRAATLVHTLRDREIDRTLGYVNHPAGVDLREWEAGIAARARAGFTMGRAALGTVRSVRARWLLWLMAWKYERLLDRLTA